MNRRMLPPASLAFALLALVAAGCSQDVTSPRSPAVNEGTAISELTQDKDLVKVPTEEEIADLLFIREEEKVARDVYLVLGEQYGLTIFAKISTSEQKHMDAIKTLLDRYALDDPVGENAIGFFVNQDLQAFYDGLVAGGQESQAEALLAGLAIEEIDILDLQSAIGRAVLPDLLKVFGKLSDGSENHLRSFVSDYETLTGTTYVPRWLSQEAYDAIINEVPDNGHRGNNRMTS